MYRLTQVFTNMVFELTLRSSFILNSSGHKRYLEKKNYMMKVSGVPLFYCFLSVMWPSRQCYILNIFTAEEIVSCLTTAFYP